MRPVCGPCIATTNLFSTRMGPGANANAEGRRPPNGPDFFRRTLGDALTPESPLIHSTTGPDVGPADQNQHRLNSSAGFPRLVPVRLAWESDSMTSLGNKVISLRARKTITAR